MTKIEFAQKIKSKYPDYNDIDDETLANSMLAKFPEYQSQIEEEPVVISKNPFDGLGYDNNEDLPKYLSENTAEANQLFMDKYKSVKDPEVRKAAYTEFQNAIQEGSKPTSDEFDAEWAKMSFDDRVVLHNKLFPEVSEENNYNQLVSYPDLVKTRVHNKMVEDGDRNTIYGFGKDVFSSTGRLLDSGKDALLSPKQVTGQSFTEDYARTSDDVFANDERSTPGKLVSSIIRDPYTTATLATGPLLKSAEAGIAGNALVKNAVAPTTNFISNILGKVPNVNKVATSVGKFTKPAIIPAIEAGTESVVETTLENQLAGKDRSTLGEAATTGLISAILGKGANVLNTRKKDKFINLLTNAGHDNAIKKYGEENFENMIDEITSKTNRKGTIDYDLGSMRQNLEKDIKKLGGQKGDSYKKLEQLNEAYKDVPTGKLNLPLEVVNQNQAKLLYQNEIDVLKNDLNNRLIGEDEFKQSIKELERIKSDHLTKRENLMNDLSGKYSADEILQIMNKKTPNVELIDLEAELAILKTKPKTDFIKDAIASKEKDIVLIQEEILNTSDTYFSNINDLFETRKSIDRSNKNFGKKLTQGAVDNVKNEMSDRARKMVNTQIVDQTDRLGNILPLDIGNVDRATYNAVIEDLAETKELPRMYAKKDIIKNIGGTGNVSKSAADLFNLANIGSTLMPASGIRNAQVGDFIGNDYYQRMISRNLSEPVSKLPLQLFNNNEEK